MPNNLPVGNLDFTSLNEALNALQRNPQVARLSLSGDVTTTFSASTLYGFVLGSSLSVLPSPCRPLAALWWLPFQRRP
jgi:hypothetical protein